MAESRPFKKLWWLFVLLFLSPVIAAVVARVLTGPMPVGNHRPWGRHAAVEATDGGSQGKE